VGLADEIAQRTTGGVEVLVGSVAGVVGDTVTVYVGGNPHPGKLVASAGYLPMPGDPVVVLRQGQVITVIGPHLPAYPTKCTVSALPDVTTDLVLVTVPGFGTRRLPFLASYTPQVSDLVEVLWRGGLDSGLILGEVGDAVAAAPPPSPPTAPPGGSQEGTSTFTAVGVGTYRGGWRTDDNGDVIQGVAPGFAGANEGAWFYGNQPHSTLNGATVTGVSIWLGRTQGGVFGAQTANLQRVNHSFRPPGGMTFTGSVSGVALAVGQEGWFSLPTSLGQDLVNNGGSIGIRNSPYMRMYGLSKSGMAGALRISWRR
jgi:hypothetical protein